MARRVLSSSLVGTCRRGGHHRHASSFVIVGTRHSAPLSLEKRGSDNGQAKRRSTTESVDTICVTMVIGGFLNFEI